MNPAARIAVASAAALVLATVAACSGGGQTAGGNQSVVNGGTLNFGVNTDPGNLDPQRSTVNDNLAVAELAYDTPVTLSATGEVLPRIVTKWQELTPTSWDLTVRPGVTCSDGSAMDAKTLADNLNYIADANNANPLGGISMPIGGKATADPATNTVRVTLPAPTPFLIEDLAIQPLVCQKGLTDRSVLATGSNGSGPYVVSDVVPGDHIDYTLRKDYSWGPTGASSTSVPGIPAKIVVKIVSNATTTANLLLNGQLNVAKVTGSDEKRLQGAGLFKAGINGPSDFVFFNHTDGLPGSDPVVRKALAMGLDMKQIIPADTGGLGSAATGLLADPKVCAGDTVTGNLPGYDPNAAKALLAQGGWVPGADGILAKNGKKLTIKLVYASDVPGPTASAQVVAAEWKQLGVDAVLGGVPAQQLISGVDAATLPWEAELLAIGVNTPAQFAPYVSGTGAPQGENFSFINNATYNSLIADAATKAGTQGCADWNTAESALFKDADVLPVGQKPSLFYGKNVSFMVSGLGNVMPTTLQLH